MLAQAWFQELKPIPVTHPVTTTPAHRIAFLTDTNAGSLPLLLSDRFIDLAPEQSWSLTVMGLLVLERYREAGADLPDGWPPAKRDASGTS
jgi:hypothetical protein